MLIRCRLSNEGDAAEEFTAQDPPSLRRGAERAFARYVAAHGPTRHGTAVSLALQVRPLRDQQAGWYPPFRGHTPVQVRVSAELIERRPPDDWSEIWDWVRASREGDAEIGRIADWVSEGGDTEDDCAAE